MPEWCRVHMVHPTSGRCWCVQHFWRTVVPVAADLGWIARRLDLQLVCSERIIEILTNTFINTYDISDESFIWNLYQTHTSIRYNAGEQLKQGGEEVPSIHYNWHQGCGPICRFLYVKATAKSALHRHRALEAAGPRDYFGPSRRPPPGARMRV